MEISTESENNKVAASFSNRQIIFLKFSLFVLIDLCVLNLFNQYWEHVIISDFTTSLYAAMLMQFLFQVTIAFEHRIGQKFFSNKTRIHHKVLHALTIWLILFISKLIILKTINLFFNNSIQFIGEMHGVVPFIVVVITMIVVERNFLRVFRALK